MRSSVRRTTVAWSIWPPRDIASRSCSTLKVIQICPHFIRRLVDTCIWYLDDIHFAALTVNRTIKFALRNKVPLERPEHHRLKKDYISDKRDEILDSLGIGHTKKTLVGNEYVRGVSGGERKRVSLAEMMAGQVCETTILHSISRIFSSDRARAEPCSTLGQSNARSRLEDCGRICEAFAA